MVRNGDFMYDDVFFTNEMFINSDVKQTMKIQGSRHSIVVFYKKDHNQTLLPLKQLICYG